MPLFNLLFWFKDRGILKSGDKTPAGFPSDMWCSFQVFLCFQLLNLKYLQNILYIGHYSHNFCLSLSKTILNYKFESLSSWLFIFWTRFALKCQRKINSWKKGFSSGTQSELIKLESLKYVPKGAVIKKHSPQLTHLQIITQQLFLFYCFD